MSRAGWITLTIAGDALWGMKYHEGTFVNAHILIPVDSRLTSAGVEAWVKEQKHAIRARGHRAKTCYRAVRADNVDVEVIVVVERSK